MPSEPQLISLDLAAYYTKRPPSTIRRWALEGRITKHPDLKRRRNGVLYDRLELPRGTVDEWTGETHLGPVPPLPKAA